MASKQPPQPEQQGSQLSPEVQGHETPREREYRESQERARGDASDQQTGGTGSTPSTPNGE